jgi:6-pyruvoyltetrahydropterin/6-carboxytetrahydropterin synthase
MRGDISMYGMFFVKKRLEISASHSLSLDYESKCKELHGHNWIITVYCKSPTLNKNGMIVDFTEIKKLVSDKFDHKNLNMVEPFDTVNSTAENMAKYLVHKIPLCYKVEVQESENNIATYELEGGFN